MRERLFPRWGAALFALLPLSEILYAPATGQTVYAAALASLICALVCAGAARLAPVWQRVRALKWMSTSTPGVSGKEKPCPLPTWGCSCKARYSQVARCGA